MVSSIGLRSVGIQSMNIASGVTCTAQFVYIWRHLLDGPHTWVSEISGCSLIITISCLSHDTRALVVFLSVCWPESAC